MKLGAMIGAGPSDDDEPTSAPGGPALMASLREALKREDDEEAFEALCELIECAKGDAGVTVKVG